MDTKSHKTVWNRIKNFTLFSSLPYTFIHIAPFAESRQTHQNETLLQLSRYVPLVTAFHITFNYYCIKRTTRVFPMTWMPPKIRWIRARIYTQPEIKHRITLQNEPKKKNGDFECLVSKFEWMFEPLESATYRILLAGSMCESKYWRLICKLRYSDYSIIWIYFEGEHRTQKLCVTFQGNVPFQNETKWIDFTIHVCVFAQCLLCVS